MPNLKEIIFLQYLNFKDSKKNFLNFLRDCILDMTFRLLLRHDSLKAKRDILNYRDVMHSPHGDTRVIFVGSQWRQGLPLSQTRM